MPREQLLELAADVDRLLAAGATAAAGHDGLSRRGRTLRELGQKVAALVPVADAVERVTSSSSREVRRAFLDLVVMARQLRGSLSGTGLEGALQAIEASGPWQTPTPTRDVYNAHEALTEEASSSALQDAAERQVTGDLRLVPSALAALESNKSSIADVVAEKVLPAVGRGVLPDLLAKLDLKGKNADARRLLAICKIDPKIGVELARKALNEGSRPLKIQALECLPEVGRPGEAEKAGLEKWKDKESSIRLAALRALRKATSDDVLELLIQALLDDHWQIPQAAQRVLTELAHPGTTERLLRETEERVAALPPPPPKLKKGAKKPARKAAEEAQQARQKAIDGLVRFIEVLADRKDARNSRVLTVLLALARHEESQIRQATMLGLGKWGNEFAEVPPILAEAITDADEEVAEAAIGALSDLDAAKREAVIPRLLEYARDTKKNEFALYDLVNLLPQHMPRFAEPILGLMGQLLRDKKGFLCGNVIQTLGAIGAAARPLLPRILDAIASKEPPATYTEVFVTIEPEGTIAIPALIKLLGHKKTNIRRDALEGLRGYGPKAKAAEPVVTKLLKDRNSAVKYNAELTLAAIKGQS